MSTKALLAVWQTGARGLQQHVLLALANRMNSRTGVCNPSIAVLSGDTGLGATTIRRAIRQLEESGLVRVLGTKGGRRQSARYVLLFGPTAETRPERPSFEGEETQPLRPSKEAETRPERHKNSAGAADVVLRTRTQEVEPVSTYTADAVCEPAADGGLFPVDEPAPPSKPGRQLAVVGEPNGGAVVAAWCEGFAETHGGMKPTREQCNRVGRHGNQLLKAGNPADRVQSAARSAGRGGWVDVTREYERLSRQAGGLIHPAGPARPSTTDARVAGALALAAEYEREGR